MLPTVVLDDERFEDILEKARRMIPKYAPFWTDYNYHDPGITLMELMAWMKENQQFYMDQIGPAHIRRYLALLGGRQRPIVPASSLITVNRPARAEIVPRGSRFRAFEVPFETVESRYLEPSGVVALCTEDGETIVGDGRLHIPVFGTDPKPGASFRVVFSAPLRKGKIHELFFLFFHGYPVRRNPVGKRGDFVPLVSLTAEYSHGGEFRPVEWWKDGTNQFLEDGFVSLRLSEDMEPDSTGRYCLRFTLAEGEYDVSPVAERISTLKLAARQTYTLSESVRFSWREGEDAVAETDTYLGMAGGYEVYLDRGNGFERFRGEIEKEREEETTRFLLRTAALPPAPGSGGRSGPGAEHTGLLLCYDPDMADRRVLGIADGFPAQETELDLPGLCAGGLELLLETEPDSGVFEEWEQAEDFSGCGPCDRRYVCEEEQNLLLFGDGIRGSIPHGRILLAAGHTSLGKRGNVKSGVIREQEAGGPFTGIVNMEAARGGRDTETLEECRERVIRDLERTERAVTCGDYEELTRRTPGLMIDKVRAIPASAEDPGAADACRLRADENLVTLVVKPYSERPRPVCSEAYIRNISRMLQPRSLIGTRFRIVPPEYIGITVYVEVEAESGHRQLRQEIGELLARFFEGQRNDFGRVVSYGSLYGEIDGMERVAAVRNLNLDAQGSLARRGPNGDILLPAGGLAYLGEWDCLFRLPDRRE